MQAFEDRTEMADTPIDDREYGVADNSDEWETPGDELRNAQPETD